MKLHRLEIEGFGPFRRRQTIDFDAFADDGLFLISGRTGAGKSSILDAVCYALYGSIPRYATGERRLRSDHSEADEPTQVALEFSVGDASYRVERSPEYERARKSGAGTTKQAAKVLLSRWDGTQWIGIGARAKDVDGELLGRILHLTKEQFLQVILLAQNRFAAFLLAKNDERRKVLRTLFGSKRFEDYAVALDTRSRAATEALAAQAAAVEQRLTDAEALLPQPGTAEAGGDAPSPEASSTPPLGAAERLAAVRAALPAIDASVAEAAAAAEHATGAYETATAQLGEQRARRAAQQRRDAARSSLAALEQDAAAVDELRREIDAAQSAEAVRSTIDLLEAARARHQAAQDTVADARVGWEAALADPFVQRALGHADEHAAAFAEPRTRPSGDADDRLRAAATALDALIGQLGRAIQREQDYPRLVAEREAAEAARFEADDAVRQREQMLEALPERLQQAREERERLLPLAAAEQAAAAEIERYRRQEEAARAAAELEPVVRAREEARLAAQAEATAAGDDVEALIRARLQGYAGELAASLVPSEPCAVCGSTTHPRPAAPSAQPVREEDIAAAETRRDGVLVRARAAEAEARQARLDYDAQHAAAAGASLESVTALRRRAEAARAEAAEAGVALDRSRAQITTLEDQQRGGAEQLRTLQDAARVARESCAVIAERERAELAAITEARDGAASVAEREGALTAARDAALRLFDGSAALVEREQRHQEASAALASQLASTLFADAAAVAAALRSDTQRAELRQRIDTFDRQRAEYRGVLATFAQDALPETAIDTADAEAQVAETKLRLSAAQHSQATVTQARQRLGELLDEIDASMVAFEAAAAQRDTIRRFADTVNGRDPNTMKMALETFVLAAELEQIVAEANTRLEEMSSGRYQLVHTDERAAYGAASGLGIEIFDAHTGRSRPTTSLSGGETFLASLALALGLAEVVTSRAGGIRLDTLFIDEGFGSLDAETLEVAMRTLDALRQGGRAVGVISHVEAMQEQIPAQLAVLLADDGSSVVRQGADR